MGEIEKIEASMLAAELFKRNMRTSIVHLITSLPRSKLRSIYKDIHKGSSPLSGLIISSGALLNTRTDHLISSVFSGTYFLLGGKDIFNNVNIEVLIKSYDFFKANELSFGRSSTMSKFDFTAAWVVARDIRSGVVTFEVCMHCDSAFISCEDSDLSRHCPCCNLIKKVNRDIYPTGTGKRLEHLSKNRATHSFL